MKPVVIKAPTSSVVGGSVEVVLSNTTEYAEPNALIKGVNLTQVLDELADSKQKVFTLGKKNNQPQFLVNAIKDYDSKSNNLFVNHNKIFLILTNEQANDMAKGLPVTVDYAVEEDITTGVNDAVSASRHSDNTIYDLQGRKVDRITHPGVYIRNGKKFVVKRGQY